MRNKNFRNSIRGKGYYIALILCAVAIGISGYLYYRNANGDDSQLKDPTSALEEPNTGKDVEAVATQPHENVTQSTGTEPTQTTAPVKDPMKTAAPLEGQTIAEYAMEHLSYNQTTRDWRVHNGIDIAAEAGTKVCAAAAGTVYTVYEDDTMGTVVVIRHEDGYTTQYASLAKEVLVAPGDTVELGQAIGCVGQTALLESAIGDHVHFSVTCDGEVMDPEEFLSLD